MNAGTISDLLADAANIRHNLRNWRLLPASLELVARSTESSTPQESKSARFEVVREASWRLEGDEIVHDSRDRHSGFRRRYS
jgi:hypothetical protein